MQEQHIEDFSREIPRHKAELLAVLEALTDPAIIHLALDDLFHAVLDRICTITGADNLAILLLDDKRTFLHIRAVHGIEEMIATEVHIPIGHGFAGLIAAQAIPLVCYDPSLVEIITPLLHEQLRSLLGVPLLVQRQVIGVLHIGMKRHYLFTDHDIALLERVADCLAQAIERALLVEAEKHAQNEVLERANELETIFETLTDGLIVYDQHGKILRTNSTSRQMLGINAQTGEEELLMKSLDEQVIVHQPRDEYGHPLKFEALPVSRILCGERLTNNEAIPIHLTTFDGKETFMQVTGAPLYDQHKQIRGAVCILHDVTQQKHIQRRLEILDALIEIVETLLQYSTPEKLGDSSKNTTVTLIQHIGHTILVMAQPLLGYSHALILEIQSETRLLSPLEMIGFPKEQEQLLKNALTHSHLSMLIADPETMTQLERQELAPFDITNSPLLQRLFPINSLPNCLLTPIYIASHMVGLLGIAFADRTYKLNLEDRTLIAAISKLCALALQYGQQALEQNRFQEARERLNIELEQVNALQSTFISVVGHEFRTALTGIEGFSELLLVEEDLTAEEAKEYAKDINNDAVRLHHMITELLDLEQMKKGKMQLHLERLAINTILTEAAKRIRLTKPDHPIQLNLDPQNPYIQVDPDKLAQMISNLLSNAIKYSPAGGEILIASIIEGPLIHLSIQDHGMGIPPERIKDIFTPYQRIASMSTRHIQGTGLGLGITKQIVELHQGNIWVESELGQGSVFHVTLPLDL